MIESYDSVVGADTIRPEEFHGSTCLLCVTDNEVDVHHPDLLITNFPTLWGRCHWVEKKLVSTKLWNWFRKLWNWFYKLEWVISDVSLVTISRTDIRFFSFLRADIRNNSVLDLVQNQWHHYLTNVKMNIWVFLSSEKSGRRRKFVRKCFHNKFKIRFVRKLVMSSNEFMIENP